MFAVIFLHILSVAFVVRVKVSCDGDKIYFALSPFFIPIVKKSVDLSVLSERHEETEEKPEKKCNGKKSKLPKKSLLRAVYRILKRVVTHRFCLRGELGTGDAASTAYAVGAIGILYTQACTFLCYDRLDGSGIKPDYDNSHINLTFDGIFSITSGDIIVALCAPIFEFFGRAAGQRREHGRYIAE